jgi:NDP-sugar pyrophosphorylase family protein
MQPDHARSNSAPFRRARGVIMAGGRSERMRVTNGPLHKALIEVAGRPLVEHNLTGLYAEGIEDIVVVTSAHEPDVASYLQHRGQQIARACGARLDVFVESEPLGNIGAVGALDDGRSDMVVVFADNLTTIPARAMLARHWAAGADLTVATHAYMLRNPFGELEIADGYVRGYREKPVRSVRISSGAYVVGSRAAALVPPGRPFGAAELCTAALSSELHVAAYEHDELWIDVNDAQALASAELLLRANPERFAR